MTIDEGKAVARSLRAAAITGLACAAVAAGACSSSDTTPPSAPPLTSAAVSSGESTASSNPASSGSGGGCASGGGCSTGSEGGHVATSTSSSGAGAPSMCGDGVREGAEQCDGADLGTVDCVKLGYSGGTLKCTAQCTFDESGCGGTENCQNGVDDDGDQKIDCADPDCTAACANPCTMPFVPLADDGSQQVNGTTVGHAPGAAPSCSSGSSGAEVVYQLTVKNTGMLEVLAQPQLDASGHLPNLVLSIRTQCDDAGTEIALPGPNVFSACDNEATGLSTLVVQSVPVTQGDVVIIAIDGNGPEDAGPFTISAESHPVACGDGHLDPPETCDPGPDGMVEGCSATCQIESSETEPNDTPATANPFDDAQGFWIARIEPAGDVDCVSIVAPSDVGSQQLVAETDDTGDGSCALGTLDTYLWLYDTAANGYAQLGSEDDGGDGKCSKALSPMGYALTPGGTYYVCVGAPPSGADANTVFSYTLEVYFQ